jgi:hypothetical protein
VNRFRTITLTLAFMILTAAFSAASDIYIAQNAAGGNTGGDCADAHAASWFNSSANWGSGQGQIGPGTTVHMCSGTYSYSGGTSCGLSFQGSGSSGSPITLTADQGTVTVTAPYWDGPANGGAICSSGYNWITIDGQNNLTLQATANGTNLANQADYGFGVWAQVGNNVTIENLTVSNIYVHTCAEPITNCTDEGGQNTGGISAQGSNVTISGNTVHDAKWCVTGGVGGNVTIANRVISGNTIYNCDHGVAVGVGDNNGVLNGLQITANDIHDFQNWDDAANNNHHDGIHIWSYNSGDSITGALIYNNYVHGNWGGGMNSALFVEAMTGLPNAYFYNNVIVDQSSVSHQGCGMICLENNGAAVLNNTLYAANVSFSSTGINNYGTGVIVQNNILQGMFEALAFPSGSSYATVNYNNYYQIGGNGWNGQGTFASWQSKCSCDLDSTNTNPNLNSSYQPTSNSTALIDQGQNLAGLGVATLDFDYAGIQRPAQGNCSPQGASSCWGLGAYQFNSGNQPPAPPTGLVANVQ